VEDNPDHVVLIQIAFTRLDTNARIDVTRSAEEAIAFLEGPWPDADYGRSRLPDLIVLDINMPGVGGLGFLEWYGARPLSVEIPVVVFSSAGGPDLARHCFERGVREFKQKPTDFGELVPIVQRVLDRWDPEASGIG
jgi:CheY-like chemotaxis protein